MSTGADHAGEELPRRVKRRRALVIIGRSLLVAAAVSAGYFVLPLTSLAADTALELLIGLVVISGLLAWQTLGILRSPLPAVQAVATIAITVPMFLVLFATTYFLMDEGDSGGFSERLTKLDALYFSISTFTTVGFGDITATSQVARAVVTTQMVLGMVLLGLIVRVIVGAVQVARSRRQPTGGD